jgi:hypothetical protein
MVPRYALQLLFSEKSQNCNKRKNKHRLGILRILDVFMHVWLNLETIKFYLIKLFTDFYWQPSYWLGELASFNSQSPEASSLKKCSCLGRALGVTNFQIWEIQFWSHFVVLLKTDLDVQQTRLSSQNKCSCLAHALGVTNLQIWEIRFCSHFVVLLKSDLDVQQTHLCILSHTNMKIRNKHRRTKCLDEPY